MSKSDGFLKRWSRLKQEPAAKPPEETESAAAPAAPNPDEAEDAFDPANLPTIESLGPDSDYAVFLRKGVPDAIRNAALRKVWVLDPIIRNFRTPADYDWDFNAPGYGALRPGDDVAKLVNQLMGPPQPAETAGEPATSVEPALAPGDAVEPLAPQSSGPRVPTTPPALSVGETYAAPVREKIKSPQGPASKPARRRHGGALPE